jgi:hypothetical protein
MKTDVVQLQDVERSPASEYEVRTPDSQRDIGGSSSFNYVSSTREEDTLLVVSDSAGRLCLPSLHHGHPLIFSQSSRPFTTAPTLTSSPLPNL